MKKNKKKGISLVVLIVTIIVIIVLAAAVIITLSKNNPIESAKEARFKADVKTLKNELAMVVSNQYTNGKRKTKINADKYTKDGSEDSVYTYISTFKDKYNEKFVIQDDELRYTSKVSEFEKEWLKEINVSKKRSNLPSPFQQVEYIESTGSQYIDTKFYADKKVSHKYIVEFQITKTATGSQTVIGHDLNDLRVDSNGYFNGNRDYPYIGLDKHDISIEFIPQNNGSEHFITTIVDETKRVERTSAYWPATSLVTLFTNSRKNYLTGRMANAKVFKASIYNNDILIREFIPCYATSKITNAYGEECEAGTVGMYETVEGKFYTDKGDKTNGEFIPGPDE